MEQHNASIAFVTKTHINTDIFVCHSHNKGFKDANMVSPKT